LPLSKLYEAPLTIQPTSMEAVKAFDTCGLTLASYTTPHSMHCARWRSDAKCRLGPTVKVHRLPPLQFTYDNLKCKEDHVLCLVKM